MTTKAKINIYTLKILKNLENAKNLCGSENINNKGRKQFKDELELEKIGLDYDTIHSEILENIIFDENDSGISDFETKEKKNSQKKIFEINKIKKIINKSVRTLFEENNKYEEFKPLIQQEKEIKNEFVNIEKTNEQNIEKDSVEIEVNNEIKIKENTEGFIEIKKENEIKNYKKYNILTDPYSNYNNFTKKFVIKENKKKRFRDIHPFLKTFNPKFLKKENINKKIFRKFRKFFKSYYKNNKNSPIISKNEFFWKKFFINNLLPPVKIEENEGEIIEHKSFNTKYLLWLFNQEGANELFKLFIEKEKENIINNFISEYNLHKSNEPNIIEKIRKYIDYIPEIYDNEKIIKLEEENDDEILDKNELDNKNVSANKKIDNITHLESFDNDNIKENHNSFLESFDNEMENTNNSNYNPFNINIDLIEKKNFKELPYDKYEPFFEEENSFSGNNEILNRNESFYLNNSFIKNLDKGYYK